VSVALPVPMLGVWEAFELPAELRACCGPRGCEMN